MRKKIGILIFILTIIVVYFDRIAQVNFLYWRFWWFDIMMHFLGGLLMGLIALWLYFLSNYFKKDNNSFDLILKTSIKKVFILSFIFVMIVGIGWEIFEFIMGISFADGYVLGYIIDTSSDLVMDVIGSFLASFILLIASNKIVLWKEKLN